MNQERELTAPVLLCAPQGNLNPAAVGWSRQPLHHANLSGRWLRKKRWNYWAITSQTHLFSLTLSDLDYMGLAFAYYLDFATGQFIEQTVMRPFGQGCHLPDEVAGQIEFTHPAMALVMVDGPEGTRLSVSSPNFGGQPLKASFLVSRPAGHESINVVIPWSHRQFQFTSKQPALPAQGEVRLGGQPIALDGFACLDYGRGIWPYRGAWNWASGSGVQGGRVVGLNLGGLWTDGTGMTENGFVVDGRVTKVHDDLAFQYDPCDFMRPWHIRTWESDQVDLAFTPFFERVAQTDAVLLRSSVHQMIGRFAGHVLTAEGERVTIDNLIGWAEEHQARW